MNAVKTYFIDVIKNHYFDFNGRADRRQYWMYILFYFILSVVINIIGAIAGDTVQGILSGLLNLALLLPTLGIGVRRLHDTDRSGWWLVVLNRFDSVYRQHRIARLLLLARNRRRQPLQQISFWYAYRSPKGSGIFLPTEKPMTREQAVSLLKKYNKEPFHLLHALTLEAVMRRFSHELGYADQADFWALCGLLHDVDFEQFPNEHCKKAPELLAEINAPAELVHAVCAHGYGLVSDVKPEHEMEKVLFAVDELTGLIQAAARMRPSKSARDMELSSLKKKFKDKKFAAGCSRDVIKQGADMLGWELDALLERTLSVMRQTEEDVRAEAAKIS